MNLLAFIFALLLIFSCTFTLSMKKLVLSQPVATTYQSHTHATRKILNSYETLCFTKMRGEKEEKEEAKKERGHAATKSAPKPRKDLRECCRINLWPLLQEGRQKHPVLYELAAKTIRTFYGKQFEGERLLDYRLLDALLLAGRASFAQKANTRVLPLEKLTLQESNVKQLYPLQSYFYRMLKGTKKGVKDPVPSLLDLFSMEMKESRICLKHASLEQLMVLFGQRAGVALFQEIGQMESGGLDADRIRDICAQSGQTLQSEDLLNLIDVHSSHQHSPQRTIVQEESEVCLKKKVFLPT